MASLDGKVAFITGAARGQGRAEAVRLASDGANIIAVDICDQIASVPYPMATPDDLAQTVKLVEDTGARIVAREADVRDHSALSAALQAGLDEFGRLDIVIANAGIAPMQSGGQGWRDVVDVNLTGVHPHRRRRDTDDGRTGRRGLDRADQFGCGPGRDRRRRCGFTRLHGGQARRRRADAGLRQSSLHRTVSGSTPFIRRRCNTPMINNEFTRQWLERITKENDAPVDFGMAIASAGRRLGGHRRRGRVAGIRRGLVHHRRDAARRRGIRQQTLMARNPAAQTAFGPMVQVAVEQYEPPQRRLVDDDLAAAILPAGQRAVVRAMRWPLLRRLTIALGERTVPGAWTIIACRKRFIDDKLAESLSDIDAVVILGSGLDTRGFRLARRSDVPVFEVDLPVNIARKKAAVQRAITADSHLGSSGRRWTSSATTSSAR